MSVFENNFISMPKLYHFTKFDTGLRILLSRSLKFGHLSQMNDVYENNKNILNKITNCYNDVNTDNINDEINHYEQISLTEDRNNLGRMGFELHQLWGKYADCGKGVCLIFNKDELLSKVIEKECVHGPVEYKIDLSQNVNTDIESNDMVEKRVKQNYNNIFFIKRKEWEHEQEYRIVKRFYSKSEEHYLDIGDSIKYVILFNTNTKKFDEKAKKEYQSFITNTIEYQILKQCINTMNIHILNYTPNLDNHEYLLIDLCKEHEVLWNENHYIKNECIKNLDL